MLKKLLALALACTMTVPIFSSVLEASAAQTDDTPLNKSARVEPSGEAGDVTYSNEEKTCGVYDAGDFRLRFEIDEEGNISVKGYEYSTYNENLVIPDKIDGHAVTWVGRFGDAGSLKSVTLPETVVELGDYAFVYCENLEKIDLPESLQKIGKCAFQGCAKLTSVNIPAGVTEIGDNAFYCCSGLTTVNIPAGLTIINDDAFSDCKSLVSIVLPEGLESIGSSAFSDCEALESVVIPDSVTSVGQKAFSGCTNLKTVSIGSGVTVLSDMLAFSGCKNMESFTVSEDNESYSSLDGVLYNKSMTKLIYFPCARTGSFTIPDGVYSLDIDTFRYSKLDTLVFSKQLSDIGGVFLDVGGLSLVYMENLTSFVVPEENEYYSSIDGMLCSKDKSRIIRCPCGKSGKLVIPDSITEIGYRSFWNCNKLTEIVFCDNITGIYEEGFRGCSSIETFTLNEGLSFINDHAFLFCTALKKIDIPRSVCYLDVGAFLGCESLEAVNIEDFSECPYVTIDGMIFSADGKTLYHCPEGKKGDIVIPDGVEIIACPAFSNNIAMTSVTMPDSVRSVGEACFSRCEKLEKAVLSKNITEMGKRVFDCCENLKTVIIPEGITQIPQYMLAYCTSIENVDIPYGVTYLPTVFMDALPVSECSLLKTVTIPDSVTDIDESFIPNLLRDQVTIIGYSESEAERYAEEYGIKFQSVGTIDFDTEFTSGDFTYVNASSRTVKITGWKGSGTEIVFPDKLDGKTVAEIDGDISMSYDNRDKITSIKLPNTITEINMDMFDGYTGLTEIYIPASVTSIIKDWYTDKCESLLRFIVDESNESFCSIDGVLFSKDGTRLIAYPDARGGEYIIPDGTVGIAAYAFKESDVQSVVMPNSVTVVEEYAFRWCDSLESVKLSENLTELTEYVFGYCEMLNNVVVPGSVDTIYGDAFESCKALSAITLSEGVRVIEEYAFQSCSALRTISLPSTTETVYKSSFSGCDALEEINCSADNSYYCSADGVLFSKDKSQIVNFPPAKSGDYVIPDGVTDIEGAFAYSNITSVTLPSSLTEIADYAFNNCGELTKVTAHDGITRIGSSAFDNCEKLTAFDIPTSVREIGYSAFSGCSGIKSFVIPDGVTIINDCTFEYCYELESVTIPDSVTEIGYSAFEQCEKLTHPTSLRSVRTICYRAFSHCTSLTEFDCGDSVEELGSSVFMGCTNLVSLRLPKGIKSVPAQTAQGCFMLKSITLPDAPEEIEYSAFEECRSLENITIPATVTSIGEDAFRGCSSLTEVVLPNGIDTINDTVFYYCINLKQVTLPDSIEQIGNYAFSDCYRLNKINSPASLKSIGHNAFERCYELESFTIPAGVTEIAQDAFNNCYRLTTLDCSSEAVAVEDGVIFSPDMTTLYRCLPSKKGVYTVPDSVTTIGHYAFESCTGLTSVELPDTVKTIEDGAFRGCQSLKTVVLPNGLTELPMSVFAYCRNLTSISIPESVAVIAESAFTACCSLESLTIPEKCTELRLTIENGKSLKTLELPDTLEYCYVQLINCDSITHLEIPANVRSYNLYLSGCDSLRKLVIPDSSDISVNNFGLDRRDLEIEMFEGKGTQYKIFYDNDVLKCRGGTGNAGVLNTIYHRTVDDPNVDENGVYTVNDRFDSSVRCTAYRVSEDNKNYTAIDGVLFNKYEDEDGQYLTLRAYPTERKGSYTLPDTVEYLDLNVFVNCSVDTLTIPAWVTAMTSTIGAFGYQNVNMDIGEYEVAPENETFASEDGVLYTKDMKTLIAIPSSVTGTFVIPDGVEYIGGYAFVGAPGLTAVEFPPTLKGIYGEALIYNNLEKILIPAQTVLDTDAYFIYYNYAYTALYNNIIVYADYGTTGQWFADANGFECRPLSMYNSKPTSDTDTTDTEETATPDKPDETDVDSDRDTDTEQTATPDKPDESDVDTDTENTDTENTDTDEKATPDKPDETDVDSDSDTEETATPDKPDTTDTNTDTPKPIGNLGDVDGDEFFTSADALMILRASVQLSELTSEEEKIADVDEDDTITSADALMVLRYSVGLEDEDSSINKPITA